jgi:hypothetical protein
MINMSAGSVMSTVFKSSPYLARMSLDFFWIYVTLVHRVHKTRRAFEKQLIFEGMSKADAQRISVCFEELKGNITGMMKQGVAGGLQQIPRRH